MIERRRAGLLVESAVIIKALDGWTSLSDLLVSFPSESVPSWTAKRGLLREFGRAMGRRHAVGLFHGDLHLRNVFCRLNENGFEFAWIDNAEGAVNAPLPMAQRVHDLDHINRAPKGLTVTDRALLWRAYVDAAGLSPDDQKVVRRRVVRKTQRFWRKKGWLTSTGFWMVERGSVYRLRSRRR